MEDAKKRQEECLATRGSLRPAPQKPMSNNAASWRSVLTSCPHCSSVLGALAKKEEPCTADGSCIYNYYGQVPKSAKAISKKSGKGVVSAA